MQKKKVCAAALASIMAMSAFAACNKGGSSGGIKDFDAFFAVGANNEINAENDIQKVIAEKTGVKVNEKWLVGQTDKEAIGMLTASGDYPDFINGGDAMKELYNAKALVAWDEYLDSGKYPNIKEFFNAYEWAQFKQDDGHIYWCNPFENIYGADKSTTQNGEAFWIQARVLEWAGYPQIKTLDQYFDTIEKYNAANPKTPEGADNIPYTILCEDWRYFCLENAPQFLDGYPNDGSCMVDKATHKIVDYNTTPTAKRYFQKLNDEYKKGIVDPESFTQSYDDYITKLSSGRVLGMVDQWWDFAFTINDVFKTKDTEKYGYNYIPLGITIDESVPENQWYTSGGTVNTSSGIAITKNCKDVEGAFKFIDDLLSQEIHDLRFWGIKDVDYKVGDDGLYYRTPEMRAQAATPQYKASHLCAYSYFPQWSGTSRDGKNAMMPGDQPSEFRETLPDPVKKVFDAYGANTYLDIMGSVNKAGAWFPMYSHSNNMSTKTEGGTAWNKMGEVKHAQLPLVVQAEDFDAAWNTYQEEYAKAKPELFVKEMQEELDRRIAMAKEYGVDPDVYGQAATK